MPRGRAAGGAANALNPAGRGNNNNNPNNNNPPLRAAAQPAGRLQLPVIGRLPVGNDDDDDDDDDYDMGDDGNANVQPAFPNGDAGIVHVQARLLQIARCPADVRTIEDAERRLQQCAIADQEHARAKREFDAAKRQLARARLTIQENERTIADLERRKTGAARLAARELTAKDEQIEELQRRLTEANHTIAAIDAEKRASEEEADRLAEALSDTAAFIRTILAERRQRH